MKKIYGKDEIVQGTPEWFIIRQLKFTASNASTIIAAGKGLETLIEEMVADYFSSQQYQEYTQKYKNDAMQRGNDFEAMARNVYEFETGSTVTEVGFAELSDHVGCSPDGLVDEEGLIEIKNHSDKVFCKLIETGKIDKKYLDQMQFQLYVMKNFGRKWVDYFGFNPNFQPNYYKERILPDSATFAKIENGLQVGVRILLNTLKNLENKLVKQEYHIEEKLEKVEEDHIVDVNKKVEDHTADVGEKVKVAETSNDFPF